VSVGERTRGWHPAGHRGGDQCVLQHGQPGSDAGRAGGV